MEKPTTGPPGVAAPAITAASDAEPAGVGPQPSRDDFLGDDGGDIARPDHAKRDARHDVDEVHAAFAQRCRQHLGAALKGDEADGCDRAPQDEVDQKRRAHSTSFGYIRT